MDMWIWYISLLYNKQRSALAHRGIKFFEEKKNEVTASTPLSKFPAVVITEWYRK